MKLGTLILAAFVPIASWGQRIPTDRAASFARLRHIQRSMTTSRSLSAAEKKLLLASLDDPSPAVRHFSALVLIQASQAALFPRPRVLGAFEAKTVAAKGLDANLFASDYQRALDLGGPLAPRLAAQSAKLSLEKPRASLDGEEKAFVSRCLESDQFGTKCLASRVLLPKERLDVVSRRWGLERLQEQASRSRGSEKVYWDYVLRVFERRQSMR